MPKEDLERHWQRSKIANDDVKMPSVLPKPVLEQKVNLAASLQANAAPQIASQVISKEVPPTMASAQETTKEMPQVATVLAAVPWGRMHSTEASLDAKTGKTVAGIELVYPSLDLSIVRKCTSFYYLGGVSSISRSLSTEALGELELFVAIN